MPQEPTDPTVDADQEETENPAPEEPEADTVELDDGDEVEIEIGVVVEADDDDDDDDDEEEIVALDGGVRPTANRLRWWLRLHHVLPRRPGGPPGRVRSPRRRSASASG